MEWTVQYTKEALQDLKSLDGMQQKHVLKAIDKVSANPLPTTEGGYGRISLCALSSSLWETMMLFTGWHSSG